MPKYLLILPIIAAAVVTGSAQTPAPAASPKVPVKMNARPTPTPTVKAEPFDKADVKTMAGQCVTFDTEAGVIEMEMFPEHAPESVRNFLNPQRQPVRHHGLSPRRSRFVIQGGDLYSRTGQVTYEIGMRARRTLPDEPNRSSTNAASSHAPARRSEHRNDQLLHPRRTGSHLDGNSPPSAVLQREWKLSTR